MDNLVFREKVREVEVLCNEYLFVLGKYLSEGEMYLVRYIDSKLEEMYVRGSVSNKVVEVLGHKRIEIITGRLDDMSQDDIYKLQLLELALLMFVNTGRLDDVYVVADMFSIELSEQPVH